MSDKHLVRIAALLRKAEATDNDHEADAYLQAAQRLATLASVDLAVARAHTAQRERRDQPVQRAVDIGAAGRRGLRTFVQLFLAVSRSNDVTCDIARDSSRVFAFGFGTDIDAVEALYASLVVQMVRASDAYVKSRAFSAESVPRLVRQQGRRARIVMAPVQAGTARINFHEAFAERIATRLAHARDAARSEAVARQGPPAGPDAGAGAGGTAGSGPAGAALALRAKEIELTDFHRAHSTARGSWGGYRATATHSAHARRAGDNAGRMAQLGGAAAIGGARRAVGGR